jgi:2-dehydro-3-deoxy-D-gluconate 5-dehydrogenase
MTSIFALPGRLALVTGASRGLGADICRSLADAGASVLATARDADLLANVVASLHGNGHLAVAADLGAPDGIERLRAAVAEHGQPLRILVNNAGYFHPQPIEQETLADLDRTLEVNLRAVFQLCQAFGGQMAEAGGGSIVNISSVLGQVGVAAVPGATALHTWVTCRARTSAIAR